MTGEPDQYSMGITIYHALTGKPPMQGNSATATMVNQTQTVLDLLSDVRPDVVSRPLANAIRKGIEKNPQNRFPSSEEFAEAVLEGLRVPPGRATVAASTPAAKPRPTVPQSKAGAGSKAKSAATRSPRPKSAQSAVSKPQKKKPASARPLAQDMEWFDLSDDDEPPSPSASSQARRRPKQSTTRNSTPPSQSLPPRKGRTKRKPKSKAKNPRTGMKQVCSA